MIWYHNLPPNSIDSFAMLVDAFVNAHPAAIKVETRKLDLSTVKKTDNEMLMEFVSRFQIEQMDLPPVADDWTCSALTQGLNPQSSLALQSKRHPLRNDRRSDQGPSSRGLISKNGFDRPLKARKAPRLLEYNFNVDAASIVSAIGRINNTKWPRPLQSDPTQRDPNLIRKYHGTHGHKIEDCRQLREEVSRLFNNRHLREFLSDRAKNHFKNRDASKQLEQEEPQHIINMIIGGVDFPRGPMIKHINVFIMRENEPEIIYRRKPFHSTTRMPRASFNLIMMHCSPNIIKLRVVKQLGLQDQIVPAARVLNGFNMACEITNGEITLPLNTAGTILEIKFYVIEGDMRYNALFGRPWVQHEGGSFDLAPGVEVPYTRRNQDGIRRTSSYK
ncbi:PREDICTED: uncharacterized protein LOC109213266 [Nicotiana attenuata]|uniref:uncharacterized protein LOC109213266 n=1 Tax=Nicotiana attenuata TaxID=49451 RepID=UPI000904668B|nr:PREDICTED: uncharacterized protein LOC109213266 [Nicotiana attenuata]